MIYKSKLATFSGAIQTFNEDLLFTQLKNVLLYSYRSAVLLIFHPEQVTKHQRDVVANTETSS